MRIFNSVNKTKYIVALALLLALAFLVAPVNIRGKSLWLVMTEFQADNNVFFDCANTSPIFMIQKKIEPLRKREDIERLKQSAKPQTSILSASGVILEKYKNNIYESDRVVYYIKACTFMAQLIITYILVADGKKRILRL